MSILTADGTYETVSDVKSMGGAQWKLAKQDGNFKISVDWQMYAESADQKELP